MHDEAVMGTEKSRSCPAALQPSATSAGEIRRDRMTDLTRGGGVPRVFVVTRQGGTDTERVAGPAEVAIHGRNHRPPALCSAPRETSSREDRHGRPSVILVDVARSHHAPRSE